MILTKPQLKEVVDADDYGNFYISLHVKEFKEFKGGLEIFHEEPRVGVEKHAQMHNGMWKLDPGTYIVTFQEQLTALPDFHFGLLMPNDATMRIGSYVIPRTYVSNGSWALFHVTKSVEIEEGSTVGLSLINRVYNLSGRFNDIEKRLENLEENSENSDEEE